MTNSISSHLKKLGDLHFVNTLTLELSRDPQTPGDPLVWPKTRNPSSHLPRQVYNSHYSFVLPEITPDPVLLAVSPSACHLIDTNKQQICQNEAGNWLKFLTGQDVKGTHPWSLAYGGHQFGQWAGQLGDGRAISLGQIINQNNEIWEIQLKGAGLTPYSRFADGYAVLRSSIREFLCSEAMHFLGIPTSRALAIVGTSRQVMREKMETGAIVCRLAPSWIRFGNFELFYSRGDYENLKLLADFTIKHHFSELLTIQGIEERYIAWLSAIVEKTAIMIAHWQSIGFCHGVMNTDNFSILGLTIDYGPFQFMDKYNPEYICNHSDETGRYRFSHQPRIALWNLVRFATTLIPFIGKERMESIHQTLAMFSTVYTKRYQEQMLKKLGIIPTDAMDTLKIFQLLVDPLLDILHELGIDYTDFFRHLSCFELQRITLESPFHAKVPEYMTHERLRDWYQIYAEQLMAWSPSDSIRQTNMKATNPRFTLRNHLAQKVIQDVESGNYSSLNEYLEVLSRPYEDGNETEQFKWGGPVPEWAVGLKCSCSS